MGVRELNGSPPGPSRSNRPKVSFQSTYHLPPRMLPRLVVEASERMKNRDRCETDLRSVPVSVTASPTLEGGDPTRAAVTRGGDA